MNKATYLFLEACASQEGEVPLADVLEVMLFSKLITTQKQFAEIVGNAVIKGFVETKDRKALLTDSGWKQVHKKRDYYGLSL